MNSGQYNQESIVFSSISNGLLENEVKFVVSFTITFKIMKNLRMNLTLCPENCRMQKVIMEDLTTINGEIHSVHKWEDFSKSSGLLRYSFSPNSSADLTLS